MPNAADILPETPRNELVRLYNGASGYDLPPGDTEQARIRVVAGRMLLKDKPVRRASNANSEVEVDIRIVQEEVDKALAWLNLHAAAAAPPRQIVVDPDWRC